MGEDDARTPADYQLDASVLVKGPRDDVFAALVTPDLIARWMIGAFDVSGPVPDPPVVGSRYRLGLLDRGARSSGLFKHDGVRFVAVMAECAPDRLARTFEVDESTTFGPSDREDAARVVLYELQSGRRGTTVRCQVQSPLPSAWQRKDGRLKVGFGLIIDKHNQSLERSLGHLRSVVEGSRRRQAKGIWGFRDASYLPQLL